MVWRKWLDSLQERERERLLRLLEARYLDEAADAERVERAAEGLPYPHLRAVLARVAERERRHAEWLREKIRSLGGTPPPPPEVPDEPTWREVIEAFESEKADLVRYVEDVYGVSDPEVRELLERIRREEEENYRDLLELVTRSEAHADGA
ncbi:ferritin family protein [Oceanithermus sp.]|uniref:ferritin family protein n=1 Tax=Oceanithermus sp. TaxID=2268145 RepID=UPI0025E2A090|nr:ferritin family protein [Oceanithermus sp.]